jgi:beta-phosphoglucomutase-like phosphatase (HAD superfamily)
MAKPETKPYAIGQLIEVGSLRYMVDSHAFHQSVESAIPPHERLRAIIFDFNGVIPDDETPHLRCFQQTLAEHGLLLTKDDYYGTYLGMDERTCAVVFLAARNGTCDRDLPRAIMDREATLFREYTTIPKPALFPGVVEFVKRAGAQYRSAITTGGRREQIDHALRGTARCPQPQKEAPRQ